MIVRSPQKRSIGDYEGPYRKAEAFRKSGSEPCGFPDSFGGVFGFLLAALGLLGASRFRIVLSFGCFLLQGCLILVVFWSWACRACTVFFCGREKAAVSY